MSENYSFSVIRTPLKKRLAKFLDVESREVNQLARHVAWIREALAMPSVDERIPQEKFDALASIAKRIQDEDIINRLRNSPEEFAEERMRQQEISRAARHNPNRKKVGRTIGRERKERHESQRSLTTPQQEEATPPSRPRGEDIE